MIQYPFMFLMIFGPKVGYLDLSFLGALGLLLLSGKGSLRANRTVLLSIALTVALFLSQLISRIFLSHIMVDDLLRLTRVILFLLIVNFTVARSKDPLTIVPLIFYSILLHCVFVVVCANIHPINEIASLVSGNDRIKPGRASGLLAGFDIAGLFAILGLLMLVCRVIVIRRIIEPIYSFILLLTAFYSSRITMLIALLTIIIWGYVFIGRLTSVVIKYIFGMGLSSIIIYFAYQFFITINVTFNLGISDVSNYYVAEVLSKHAKQAQDQILWEKMLFFPNTFFGMLFGTGHDVLESDIGYVKEIYRYGLFGLAVVIYIHYSLLRMALKSKINSAISKHFKMLAVFTFLLTIILSFKNNYFFTRSFFPFYILIVFISYYYGLSCKQQSSTPPFSKPRRHGL